MVGGISDGHLQRVCFFVMTSLKATVEAFRQLDPANTRTGLKDISGRAILTARQTKPTSKMPDGSK